VARRQGCAVSRAAPWAAPWPAVVAALALAAPGMAATSEQSDVPYVPTPAVVVEAMLKLAEVGPQDYLIDLGSGDGRLVITAARRHGTRGFGVEIEPALVRAARVEAQRQGVAGRVEFVEENLFVTDIARATVMALYLYPRVLMQLRPRLLGDLRPGTRIVSHDFDLGDWRPDAHLTVPVPDKPYGPPRSEVYLWVVPANAAGDWRWRRAGAEGEITLTLTQTFQVLEGGTLVQGQPARVEEGRMQGDRISFILVSGTAGRVFRQAFSGRIGGDTIEGTVRQDGGEAGWQATRVRRGQHQDK
jgi:SAM-dependent methyltransferase